MGGNIKVLQFIVLLRDANSHMVPVVRQRRLVRALSAPVKFTAPTEEWTSAASNRKSACKLVMPQ
jgi:hypothetical protein